MCGKGSTFHGNYVLSRVERNNFNIFEWGKIKGIVKAEVLIFDAYALR